MWIGATEWGRLRRPLRLSGMEGQTIDRQVPVTTIDEACGAAGIRDDFIKIDVEGLEPKVISGVHQIIDAGTLIIIFELWESRWKLYQEMITFLAERYDLVKTSDGIARAPLLRDSTQRYRSAKPRGLFSRVRGIWGDLTVLRA